MENENSGKKSKSKLIIIGLLVLIILIVGVSVFFLVSDTGVEDIKAKFESKDEYTILLDEFVTNLQNEDKGKNYLKIQVALMYTDKKDSPAIEANTSKIRDIILNDLRGKGADEILAVEKTGELKTQILDKLNESLGEGVIEEVYFTNLVVQ